MLSKIPRGSTPCHGQRLDGQGAPRSSWARPWGPTVELPGRSHWRDSRVVTAPSTITPKHALANMLRHEVFGPGP
nr:MAG: hypothetical protein H2Rhizo3311660_000002 [Mitovirus sp.]